MQYDYLGEFFVIARCGTFSAAAGELGVSQPSLGRHLSALEAELGVKLLDRGPAGVKLTAAGRKAFAAAEKIHALESSLVEHFQDPERRSRERVLAVACSYLDEYTRRILERSTERLNGEGYAVSLDVSRLPADEDVARLLLDRDVDLAVCFRAQAIGAADCGCSVQPFYTMSGGAVYQRDSAPNADELALEDLLDEVFTLGREPGQHALWDELLRICDARNLPAPALRAPRRSGSLAVRTSDARLCACDAMHPAAHAAGERVVPVDGLVFEAVLVTRPEDDVAARAAQIACEVVQNARAPQPADQDSMYVAIPKTEMHVGALTLAEQGACLSQVLDEPRVARDLVLPDGTVVDKVYVALRNRLNRIGDGLSGDPVATSFEAIMRLWSKEEAQAYLEMPLLQSFTAYDFAESSGRTLQECERLLASLSSRNLVFRQVRGGVTRYYLLAWTYGIWEFMVNSYQDGFLDLGIYGHDLGSASQFPTMRVCPVGPEVLRGGEGLSPYWDWRSLIERQDLICVAPCQCQLSYEVEKAHEQGQPRTECAPGEQRGICLTFGDMARYWQENGNGAPIGKQECLERVNAAVYQRGCVPQAIYSKNPEVLCFCDPAYCRVLAGVRSTCGAAPSMALSSAYRLRYDSESCTHCARCVGVCPMGALAVEPDGTVSVGPTCMSCGHCVLACRSRALSLAQKEGVAKPRLPEDLLEDYRWRSEDRMARGYITDFAQDRLDLLAGL